MQRRVRGPFARFIQNFDEEEEEEEVRQGVLRQGSVPSFSLTYSFLAPAPVSLAPGPLFPPSFPSLTPGSASLSRPRSLLLRERRLFAR